MHLSLRIPLITALILLLTLAVNIFGFKKSIERYMPDYVAAQKAESQKLALNPAKLEAILSAGEESQYDETLKELNFINSSLENLSTNPELYISNGEAAPSSQAFFLVSQSAAQEENNPIKDITYLISHPFDFESNSPEWKLFKSILFDFITINIVWFLVIFVFYFLWIRRVFAPVHIIIDRLQEILQNPENSQIDYRKKDEFKPLISALNQLQKSLNDQEKVRSHFLADLSHEIRTPITSVNCYLEAIRDGVMTLDRESIPLIQKEIARLIDITEQIMSYESLVNEKTGNTKKSQLSLSKITSEIIAQYQPQILQNQQKIYNNFTQESSILADENQYRQILHNIFSNFIKYAGKKSTLSCKCEVKEKKCYLIFSDTGVGIDDEKIDFVRKKFFKGSMDRWHNSKNSTSMGIWLSIIDRITTLHGGTLQLHKNQPTGLVITLYFPN